MRYRLHRRWEGSGDLDLLTDHRTREHLLLVHVFTGAELRARDERIVRAALEWGIEYTRWPTGDDWDAIIAAAEADQ